MAKQTIHGKNGATLTAGGLATRCLSYCSYCRHGAAGTYEAEKPTRNRYGEEILMNLTLCEKHGKTFAKKHGMEWPAEWGK